MTARTVILPDGRQASMVPADEAGEFSLSVADGNIAHLRMAGVLTGRQCDAAAELARLYGIGGGRSPWRTSGGSDRAEEAVEAARREFADLLRCAPRRCHWPLTVLAMGEWMVSPDPLPMWRVGLDAVALRLYGAPESR
jgi:hypothetical protein